MTPPDGRAQAVPLARWKDLCLDANDQHLVGEFWAALLQRPIETSPGRLSIEPVSPGADHERIWVNAVDRPKTVKNRLHLDIAAESVASIEALGATVLARAEDTGFAWTVMADPEGHEFCCFVRAPADLPSYRLHGIGIDCVDAQAQAAWWGQVLGRPLKRWEGEDFVTIEHATPDPVLTLDFDAVPEPRVGPNRVHWDLVGDADAIVAAGATHLWDHDGGGAVLADPEGNEFCVFPEG